MPPEASKFLFDMRAACDLIASFTAGMNFRDYKHDARARSAVERQFQVEDEVVWGVVKVNLPTLQDTLNHLLGP